MSLKATRILMGMPVTIEVVDPEAVPAVLEEVFQYFVYIDDKFSTYKASSEISLINQGVLPIEESTLDMQTVFNLAAEMKTATGGYFNILHGGSLDPSGLVKGWAISNAADLIRQHGFSNFYVNAGGDFQVSGKNNQGQDWRVGIRSPFNLKEIVKVLSVSDCGVATSGTYVRGQHVYNPLEPEKAITDILSLTVVGPDVYAADCLATAAFAMGKDGIRFIQSQDDFEGYLIEADGIATFTTGFERYLVHD